MSLFLETGVQKPVQDHDSTHDMHRNSVAYLVTSGEWMWEDGRPTQIKLRVPHKCLIVLVLREAGIPSHYSLDINLRTSEIKAAVEATFLGKGGGAAA